MKVAEATELKGLQIRREKLKGELNAAKGEQKEANKRIQDLQRKLQELEDKIHHFEARNKTPIVTEHAMLRYFERVLHFNLEEIKTRILTDKLLELHSTLGDGTFPVDGHTSFRAKIKDNSVITILE